jgi:hypothetical protein
LAEQALGVGDGAAEPKGWPIVGDEVGAAAGQNRGPGEVLCGAGQSGDGVEFWLVVAGAVGVVLNLPGAVRVAAGCSGLGPRPSRSKEGKPNQNQDRRQDCTHVCSP